MSYQGDVFNLPLVAPGLGYSRNTLIPPPQIMEDIHNCNIHQLGVGKRGGTFKFPTVGIFAAGNGGFEEGIDIGWTDNNSVLNQTLISDDFVDSGLSGYTIQNTPPDSVVEMSPSGQLHLLDKDNSLSAKIFQDFGSIPDSYSYSNRIKFDNSTLGASMIQEVHAGTYLLFVEMTIGSGIKIFTSVGGPPTYLAGSSDLLDTAWHTWKFNVFGGLTVDIYRDDVLVYAGITCDASITATNGTWATWLQGTSTLTVEVHYDWFTIVDPVRSGNFSGKLVASGGATNGVISDAFTIDPNIDYSINLFYFVTAYAAGTAEIEMVFNDGSVTTVDIVSVSATTSEWVELTYTFGPNGTTIIPSDATTVTFQQKWTGSATGTFFVDDFSIPTTSARITGLKQFISAKGANRILRATADGTLWNGLASQIKTGLATRGDEVLTEGDFFFVVSPGQDKWDLTGDFDASYTNSALNYTHSGGTGTATQPKGNFQTDVKPLTSYEFIYTVSNNVDTPACNITTEIATLTTALDLSSGTHTLIFTTNSNPGGFVLDVVSAGTDGFTLDDVSLKEVIAYPVDISNYLKKAVFTNGRDVPQVYTGLRVLDDPVAPTPGLIAATAGNIDNGKHSYRITFSSPEGETAGSPASIEIDVIDNSIEGQVLLTEIPIGPSEVVMRSVYRTEADGTTYRLIADIQDNITTTYIDNIADGAGAIIKESSRAATGTVSFDWGVDGIARPTALSAAGDGAGSGLLLDAAAVYGYKVTFHNAHGETIGGAVTLITTVGTWDQVNLTDIAVGLTGVIARSIYRTDGGGSDYKLLTVLGDNTTTAYTDNKADASLGDNAPTSNTAAARPSDWVGTNNPKYAFEHASGNTEGIVFFGCEDNLDQVYIVPDGTEDASDANIKQFTFRSKGLRGKNVIVGGIEYGTNLLMFSQDAAWLIDKSDLDISNWTYIRVPWKGGTVNNNTLVSVNNDVHSMEPNGNIYSLKRVRESGDTSIASLTRPTLARPFSVDRWIQDNVDFSFSSEFHGEFDEELQAVFWWVVRKGQTQCDTALTYFVQLDRWVIMDNRDSASGFSASVSARIVNEDGTKTIYTGGYNGDLWDLNQISKNDDSNGYWSGFKLHPLLLPKNEIIRNRRFDKVFLIQEVNADVDLQVEGFVDSVSTTEQAVTSNAKKTNYDIQKIGQEVAIEVYNNTANEDFFLMALVFYYELLDNPPA